MDEVESGLTCGERLLLCSLRVLASEGGCVGLRPSFEQACGCAGGQAFRALEVFVQQLRRHGRRRIVVGPPSIARPTGDEGLILQAFAFAQAEDYQALDARLELLLGCEPPGTLGGAACVVAEAFALNGLVLPPALTAGSPGPRRAGPPPSAPPRPRPHGHAISPARTSDAC